MAERMTLLLIGGYIGALALGAYELQRVPSIPGDVPGQAGRPLPPLTMPPAAIENIAAFDAITERPLFSPDRQPSSIDPTPARAPAKAQADDVDRMRLTAVLRGPDSLTALLEDKSGQTKILHLGDNLGKWRIAEIMDDRVVIESDGRNKTLLVHRFDPVSVSRRPLRRPKPSARQITRRPPAAVNPRANAGGRQTDKTPDKP